MKELPLQDNCLNCSTPLTEENLFCPHCGQKKLSHHDFTLRHLVVDSFADYFHFDGKFITTMKSMVLHPGQMTNEFLAGKRVKFIQPFKLFLFISILYFILIGIPDVTPQKHDQGADTFHISLPGSQRLSLPEAREIVDRDGIDAAVDSLLPNAGWFTKMISKRILSNTIHGPEVLTEKFIHNASKVVFILIPVMALLLKLLYLRKKKLYFDHLIFAFHFHAMFFMLLILYDVISYFVSSYVFIALFMGIVMYLYWMMRKVYEQSRGRTLAKLVMLFFGFIIVALPVFAFFLFFFSVVV